MKPSVVLGLSALMLAACVSTPVEVKKADGSVQKIAFYTGSENLEDLIMVDDEVYTGKLTYDIMNPVGDIAFVFTDGEKVSATCDKIGKSPEGEAVCEEYKITSSDVDLFEEGDTVKNPMLGN